jgi:hypothetical protein
MTDAQSIYAALYGPSSEELRRSLAGIGDHLQQALEELHTRPSPDAADRLSIELEGARRAVVRFRERLLAEERSDGR